MTGVLVLDLTRDVVHEGDDRRRLVDLFTAPDGAFVRVDIGARWYPWDATVDLLRQHADRLRLEVVGSTTAAVRAWVTAIQPEPVEIFGDRQERERQDHLERVARHIDGGDAA